MTIREELEEQILDFVLRSKTEEMPNLIIMHPDTWDLLIRETPHHKYMDYSIRGSLDSNPRFKYMDKIMDVIRSEQDINPEDSRFKLY